MNLYHFWFQRASREQDGRNGSCESNQDEDNKFTLIFLMSCLDFREA